MNAPFFSTGFSENGKKAKKRFDNILGKKRKMSISAIIVITLLTATVSALVACKSNNIGIISGADGPTAVFISDEKNPIPEQLFESKLEYTGDNSGVLKICTLLGDEAIGTSKGIELATKKAPYGIIRKYSTAMYNQPEAQRQAAVMLSLIENAIFIRFKFSDGQFDFIRTDLDGIYGTLSEHSKDLASFVKFYNSLGFSGLAPEISEMQTLDARISNAILSRSGGRFLSGECAAEGHVVLGTENDEKIIYMLASYGEYGFENGNFVKISGTGILAVRLTFDENGNLTEYKEPMDGSKYTESIKETFPVKYHSLIFDSEKYYDILKQQEHLYAKKYLESIGRDAIIGEYGDFEHTLLTDKGVPTDVANMLITLKSNGLYPYWIGNRERVESGVRYVYSLNLDGNVISYAKTNYETGKIVNITQFDAETGKKLN